MELANVNVSNYDMVIAIDQVDGMARWTKYDAKAKKAKFRYAHEDVDLSAVTGMHNVEVALMDFATMVARKVIMDAAQNQESRRVLMVLPTRNAIRCFEMMKKWKVSSDIDEVKAALQKGWMSDDSAWKQSLDALVDTVYAAQMVGVGIGFESRFGLRHYNLVPVTPGVELDNIEDGQELKVQNGEIEDNPDWKVSSSFATGIFKAEVRRSTGRNGKVFVTRSIPRYTDEQLRVDWKATVNGEEMELKLPSNPHMANVWIADSILSRVLPHMQIGGDIEAEDIDFSENAEEQMEVGGSVE